MGETHVMEFKIKETSLTSKPTANITLDAKTWQVFSLLSGTRKGALFFHCFSLSPRIVPDGISQQEDK